MVDPISIFSAVNLCFKYGKILLDLCAKVVHAKAEIAERMLRIKNYWMRAKHQLDVVRSIANELSEEHRYIQYETIEMLGMKLKVTIETIEGTIIQNPADQVVHVRQWKYALTQQKIDRTIKDLKEWQDLFDPSWYLIMKSADGHIDSQLMTPEDADVGDLQNPISCARSLRYALKSLADAKSPSLSIAESSLESVNLRDMPFCSAQLGADKHGLFITERIKSLPGVDFNSLKKDVRVLTRKLSQSNALQFGILKCQGYIHHHRKGPIDVRPNIYTLIFRLPAGYSQPWTLRHYLQEMNYTDSLSDRFRLANQLARAVSYVHTFGFVHKNIRPETVLLLRNGESSIGSAFLIGFDSFRAASGHTLRQGQTAWERCLYQHPQRIGHSPSKDYIMQHDIYSLGVCLLELGLWESFVSYGDSNAALSDTGNGPQPTMAPILASEPQSVLFKDDLLLLARGELRKRMGSIYSQVVITCLTCLDAGNLDFGDESEFQDENGVVVGVRYIEKVTMRLNSISI